MTFPIDEDLFTKDLSTIPDPDIGKILVTGATGYIGGRLIPELLERGYSVTALVRRNPEVFHQRWHQLGMQSA